MARRRWAGLPIAAQLLALLLGGLVVAQLVTAMIVLELPPPHAPVYRISDVAAALNGGSLQPPYGRRLIVETSQTPPHANRANGVGAAAIRRELAQSLRVPESRIRVALYPRLHLFDGVRGEWGGRRFPPGRRAGDRGPLPSPDAQQGPPPNGGPPQGPRGDAGPLGPFHHGEPPIVGDFAAGVQAEHGGWTVVRSQPEAFPNDWQRRDAAVAGGLHRR